MRRSLRHNASRPPAVRRLGNWRDDLFFYWHTTDKSAVGFLAMLALPLVMLGCIVRFAYVDHLRMAAAQQRRAELVCLAENVYFEARGEPLAGQHAVAEVTLNRVASPQFPDTVCDVVHEQRWDAIRKRYVGAFSWTELEPSRKPRGREWERAMAVASAVYDKQEAPRVSGALFYHASHMEPAWARTKKPVARIGRHVFYQ
jgi:spore germination cell wall hydrolase CwlJ-like protein